MLPEKIMQSDFIDLLFENRNKSYGAYALRRSYNKTLMYSTSITLFIAVAFSFLQFMHHKNDALFAAQVMLTPDQELVKVIPPEKQPEPALNKPVEKKFNQKIFTPPVISDENTNTQTPTTDDLDRSIIGPDNITGENADGTIQPPVETGDSKGNQPTVEKIIPGDKPVSFAEVMPEYPGGLEALKRFMLRNLKQPDDLQPGEKIVVKACFVVNKNGNIEQVEILNNTRNDLSKEVQRVINKMPVWKPGMQNGASIAVYFTLPITFMGEEE